MVNYRLISLALTLEPVSDSPEFRTLYPENICIFGVVTHVIHRTRELR